MNNSNRKKVKVIINPVAGTKSKKSIVESIGHLIDSERFDVEIVYTEYKGHATEITSDAIKNNTDIVLAVGGDGTINEIAKALIDTEVALGIVPCGSGNGLARDLNIPMNVQKALKVLNEAYVKKIDYGIANDNVFFCTCGVGFDAKVSEKALTQTKRGLLMYAKNCLSVFSHFKPEKYKITYEGGVFEDEAFVVTCANISQYGNNAYIAPYADWQDGKMNITILKPLSVLNAPKVVVQMFTKKLANNAKFVEYITPEAVIEMEKEGVMHLDGSAIVIDKKEIHVKIIKQGLNVIVPKE
ncbi:MAG: YegS/Rv2252/BmrU family lipid kinase [Prevotellaceae bacterium]|nr:YegS/Rv2252/BmrU family lipid kinase [Prevotellaceae bacterium]